MTRGRDSTPSEPADRDTATPGPPPAISDVADAALLAWLATHGQPRYRLGQIRRHAARTSAADWGALTDLPVALRDALSADFRWSAVVPVTELASADGETRKALLRLHDGHLIESVLMPHHGARNSVCLSTQAGCPMACAFCATGEMGLIRNLTSGEIVDQVRYWQRELARQGERVSHVVYMGMGEPFNNYGPTLASVRALIAGDAFGISPRRITISTCGVVPKIDQLAAEGLPINLAVSLHAADDRTRTAIMPINQRWGIDEVLAASARYVRSTKRRVTFEYILLAGVNDSEKAATALATRIAGSGPVRDYHVNLIPVNAGPGGFRRPESGAMERFAQVLRSAGIAATVRISKGQDIQAGCGQLKVEERSPAKEHAQAVKGRPPGGAG
ncbi:MAG TPA: 23S rRNA (adenine(2503)-C(2))-methyltransferase RlmN [Candidatus Saccharimonadales bacterium]|nr:23S rRNA (adenine(2503)-C(2))-methyltransferase RlmN [Candidatus Saccharimonadales bacterium]